MGITDGIQDAILRLSGVLSHDQLQDATREALILALPNVSDAVVYVQSSDGLDLVSSQGLLHTLPKEGLAWEAVQKRQRVTAKGLADSDPLSGLLPSGMAPLSITRKVICSPVEDKESDKIVAVFVVVCDELSKENHQHLTFLEKQLLVCLKRLKKTAQLHSGSQTSNNTASPVNASAILQLCADLYDDDAPTLQLKVIKYLQNQTRAQAGFLLLVAPEHRELVCQVLGEKVLEEELRFPNDKNSFATVIKTKKIITLADIGEEHRRELEEVLGYHVESLLCVPVISRGKGDVIAIQCMLNKQGASRFTEDDIHIIRHCYEHTAAVLTSTLAVQNERRLKKQTQTMLQVAKNLFTHLGESLTSLKDEDSPLTNSMIAARGGRILYPESPASLRTGYSGFSCTVNSKEIPKNAQSTSSEEYRDKEMPGNSPGCSKVLKGKSRFQSGSSPSKSPREAGKPYNRPESPRRSSPRRKCKSSPEKRSPANSPVGRSPKLPLESPTRQSRRIAEKLARANRLAIGKTGLASLSEQFIPLHQYCKDRCSEANADSKVRKSTVCKTQNLLSVPVSPSGAETRRITRSMDRECTNKENRDGEVETDFVVKIEDTDTRKWHKMVLTVSASGTSIYSFPQCTLSEASVKSRWKMDLLGDSKWILGLPRITLELPNQIPISVLSADDLTVLLREIMQEARNLTKAERCSVFLLEKETDELVAKVFDGDIRQGKEVKPLTQTEVRIPASQGIAGHVATTGEILNIDDAYTHPLFYRGVDDATGFRTRNILCFPIMDETGVIIGVAQLCNKMHGAGFSQFDEEIAQAFSIYCCISIVHSLLYQKVRDAQVRNQLANELMIYHMLVDQKDVNALMAEEIPPPTHYDPSFHKFYFTPRSINYDETPLAVLCMLEDMGFMKKYRIPKDKFCRFVLMVRRGYRDPPYHNWHHAFAVGHFCYLLFKETNVTNMLSDLDLLALFVACLCHDIDHRGTTNSFQVKSGSALATLYSSEGSVMERHHFAQTMCIINSPGCNIFENLKRDDYEQILDLIRDIILATDMAHHIRIFKDLEQMAKDGYDGTKPKHRKQLLCLLMTSCDLSDQTKNWKNTKKIAELIYHEFFSQGDMEKAYGHNPMAMMDREKAYIPELQIGFLDSIALPLFRVLKDTVESCSSVYDAVYRNRINWVKMNDKIKQLQLVSNSSMEIFDVDLDPENADNDTENTSKNSSQV